MKLLFVLHQYMPRHVTGTEQYARSLAHGLQRRGHEVSVFAFEPLIQYAAPGELWFERDESVAGIPVHRLSIHPCMAPNRELAEVENPLVGQMYGDYLGRNEFDLVHVFHPRNTGSDAITEARYRGVPVVVNLMDFWFVCPNFLLMRRDGSLCDGPPEGGRGCIPCMDPKLQDELEELGILDELAPLDGLSPPRAGHADTVARRAHALMGRRERSLAALGQADAVIAPSRFLQSVFADNGFPADRMQLLPYGLDASRFIEMPPAKAVPGEPHLDVGYIGSISRHKGIHVLLEAARAIDSDRLRVHVYGFMDSHPEYGEELRTLAGSDDRIVFHGRFEPEQLGGVLRSLDVTVVPSLWYENTPFSMLESLHAGVPVIASDLGGISEVVQEGQNGLLFPAGSADALADAMRRVLDDPEQITRLRRDAKVPDIDENVDRLEVLYTELIQRREAAG